MLFGTATQSRSKQLTDKGLNYGVEHKWGITTCTVQ